MQRTKTTIHLPADIYTDMIKLAGNLGISFNALITLCATNYIQNQNITLNNKK